MPGDRDRDMYPAIPAGDLTDDKLVAKRLDNLAREVSSGFERIELALEKLGNRRTDDHDRLEELERRVAQLEAVAG